MLLKLIFEFILSITYEKFWHSDTCGRTKSSAVNATCDPNIDLQFATASSVAAMKIIENSSIWDKMKYEFNFLNKELCQIFFSVFWPTKFRPLI